MDMDAMECHVRQPNRMPTVDVLVAIPNAGYEASELLREASRLLADYNQGSVVLRCLRVAVQYIKENRDGIGRT